MAEAAGSGPLQPPSGVHYTGPVRDDQPGPDFAPRLIVHELFHATIAHSVNGSGSGHLSFVVTGH